jgi:hypothetical protein
MSLQRWVGRFSSGELRALDQRRDGISRASVVRAVVRVWLDGKVADTLVVDHLVEIGKQKRASNRPARPAGLPSVRARVLEVLEAHPGEVFTPARLVSLVGGGLRDTIRNALLVLSEQGHVEKLGPGQYRARARADVQADASPDAGADEAA